MEHPPILEQEDVVPREKVPQAKLALVLPTLHEAGNIRAVLQRVRNSLDPLGISYEVIVVDDDSRDGTAEIVHAVRESDPRVRLLVRSNARSLGGAVVHGWERSGAEVVGVMDADLQHPPELLPQLWKAIESGVDLALASRYAGPGGLHDWNLARRGLSRLAVWLTQPLQKPEIRVLDPMTGFFLVRRTCIRDVALETKGFKILLEILVRGEVRSTAEIPFCFGVRKSGVSKAGIREGLNYIFLLGRLWRDTRAPWRTAQTARNHLHH